MMVLEPVAALLVGLAVLVLILGPLARPVRPPPPDEPEEFEETPKGQALAALKEIEFDRATGKLSEEDYRQLNAKYTERAVQVMRDEAGQEAAAAGPTLPPGAGGAERPAGGASDQVEALIAARVHQIRQSEPRCLTCGPRPEADAVYCSSCGRGLHEAATCAVCGGALETGGRFCGSCGAAVAA